MAKQSVLTFREQIDQLRGLWSRARRRAVIAGVIFGVGVIGAFAFAILTPRKYISEAQILYREGIRSTDITSGESLQDPTRKLALRLQEMVLSRNRLESIIKEFDLYPGVVAARGYVDAEDEMRAKIKFRIKDGDNFFLSFTDSDPDRVQKVTARLAAGLILEMTRSKTKQAELTRDFLDAEKRRVDDEVRGHEVDVARFLAKHPEFAREQSAGASGMARIGRPTVAATPSKSTDPTLLALEREGQRLQERLGMAVPVRTKPDGPADPKLLAAKNDAENELAIAQRDYADKSGRYTEQHPDVVAAKQRVKNAEARVKRATESFVTGTAAPAPKEDDSGIIDRATLESQLAKNTELIRQYKARKAKAGGGGDDAVASTAATGNAAAAVIALETDWARLQRELSESRDRLDKVQEKQFRATMLDTVAQSGHAAQMEIVDEAYRPTHPAPPGRSVLALIGIAIALLLAGGVTLLLAILDDRLYYANEVERLSLGDVLGTVPNTQRERRINRG